MTEVHYVFEIQSKRDAADSYIAAPEGMIRNVAASCVYRTHEEAASSLQELVPPGKNPAEYGNYRIEKVPYNSFYH